MEREDGEEDEWEVEEGGIERKEGVRRGKGEKSKEKGGGWRSKRKGAKEKEEYRKKRAGEEERR